MYIFVIEQHQVEQEELVIKFRDVAEATLLRLIVERVCHCRHRLVSLVALARERVVVAPRRGHQRQRQGRTQRGRMRVRVPRRMRRQSQWTARHGVCERCKNRWRWRGHRWTSHSRCWRVNSFLLLPSVKTNKI